MAERRKTAGELFYHAVESYRGGTDFNLRDAVKGIDESLELAFEEYLQKERILLPKRGDSYFARLVDFVLTNMSGHGLSSKQVERLKYHFRNLRNRVVHQQVVPEACNVLEFIKLAVNYFHLLNVDISEAKMIIGEIRLGDTRPQTSTNFDAALDTLIAKTKDMMVLDLLDEDHLLEYVTTETMFLALDNIRNAISNVRIETINNIKERVSQTIYQELVRAAQSDIENIKRNIEVLKGLLYKYEDGQYIIIDDPYSLHTDETIEYLIIARSIHLSDLYDYCIINSEESEDLQAVISEPEVFNAKLKELIKVRQEQIENITINSIQSPIV